jgi:hypothetical protein
VPPMFVGLQPVRRLRQPPISESWRREAPTQGCCRTPISESSFADLQPERSRNCAAHVCRSPISETTSSTSNQRELAAGSAHSGAKLSSNQRLPTEWSAGGFYISPISAVLFMGLLNKLRQLRFGASSHGRPSSLSRESSAVFGPTNLVQISQAAPRACRNEKSKPGTFSGAQEESSFGKKRACSSEHCIFFSRTE